MKYTIDATGKKLGRVATEAATILMGKNTPGYQRHMLSGNEVEVVHASALAVTEKKRDQETYKTFSGYPGGLKTKNMDKVIAQKGYRELVKIAIKGMLPKNKLQSKMMKNLTVTE